MLITTTYTSKVLYKCSSFSTIMHSASFLSGKMSKVSTYSNNFLLIKNLEMVQRQTSWTQYKWQVNSSLYLQVGTWLIGDYKMVSRLADLRLVCAYGFLDEPVSRWNFSLLVMWIYFRTQLWSFRVSIVWSFADCNILDKIFLAILLWSILRFYSYINLLSAPWARTGVYMDTMHHNNFFHTCHLS